MLIRDSLPFLQVDVAVTTPTMKGGRQSVFSLAIAVLSRTKMNGPIQALLE